MGDRDFQFDLALQSALNCWIKKVLYLGDAVECAKDMFFFNKGRLSVDLACFNDQYYKRFVGPMSADYCELLLILMQKPLAEFLMLYGFPSCSLVIELHTDKFGYTRTLAIGAPMESTIS